jgi:hypothetical protein
MEHFGATKTKLVTGKWLKEMVGTRRLELLTSTVSIIEPLSNPRYPISEPATKVGPVIEAGEIRGIQHTRDTQLLRALFPAASGRLSDSQPFFESAGPPLSKQNSAHNLRSRSSTRDSLVPVAAECTNRHATTTVPRPVRMLPSNRHP